MVIQSNMSPKAIVEIWDNTANVFKVHDVPINENCLETLLPPEKLNILIQDLNDAIGSTTSTCIGGG